MTREDAIKVLSILKAAYPNSYKGMTKDEANGAISVWAIQFSNIPVNIVMIAINKIISNSTFPPSISEVRKKIRDLYYEARNMLIEHEYATEGLPSGDPNEERVYCGRALSPQELATAQQIVEVTRPMTRANSETSLADMITNSSGSLLIENKKGE